MGPQSNWAVLEQTLRRGVREVMKPQDAVLERESFNTHTNIEYLYKYAREKGWKSVLLMTSPYHMRRAVMIAGQVGSSEGIGLQIHTLTVLQEPFESGEWRTSLQGMRVTLEEFAKLLYTQWRGSR
jgi:uncharacterized SAM-binding protein YcdF (DUF218 family)